MCPRHAHGLWVMVEKPRGKCAHDIAADLERLVDGWRQVNRTGQWLKIVRVEREWIDEAVPPGDIARMMGHNHPRQPGTVLHQDGVVALAIDRVQFARPVKITFAVR